MKDRPGTSASTRETDEARVARHGAPAELDAVLHAGVALGLLVRRRVDRNEDHAVEPELQPRLLGAHEMPEVRRVERAAEEADPRQARIWPSPSTR